jgi:hypothetical protein
MGVLQATAPLGDGKLYFDRTRTLINEANCGRYLTLKCENNEDTFEKLSIVLLELIVHAAAGSRVKNVWRLKEGCLSIETIDLEQAKNLIRLSNISRLFEVIVEEKETTNHTKNERSSFQEKFFPTLEISRRQAWEIKMKQSRQITSWTALRISHHCKETSDTRWQNHRYKVDFKAQPFNWFDG